MMTQAKIGDTTIIRTTGRRQLAGMVLAIASGSGITAGVAASVADYVPTASDADLITASGSDDTIIRLCDEVIDLELAHFAIYDGPHAIAGDEEAGRMAAPINARMNLLIRELSTAQATTALGILTKVRALAAFNGHFGFSFDFPDDESSGSLLASIMRDAAAMGTPLPHQIPGPVWPSDAEGDAA